MNNINNKDIYNYNFYKEQTVSSIKAAEIILKILFDIYTPQSIIDVGCGLGCWLSVAKSYGSTQLKGLDGNWITKNDLICSDIDFESINLENHILLNQKYDLCISIEVAEHLTLQKSEQFIRLLCQSSDVVLFSAAVKYQGGPNHINEQWQSFWINLFHKYGFCCFDIFRPYIWNIESIDWWFRQNVFLFAKNFTTIIDLEKVKAMEKPIYDIIHPLNYEKKIFS